MNESNFRKGYIETLASIGIEDDEEIHDMVEKRVQGARNIAKTYGMDIEEVFDLLIYR